MRSSRSREADEDKLAPALHKLMEEDQMVRFFRDPQTNEFLVAGSGQTHIEAIVSKLKKRYHTEVTLKAPKVPYRETIRGQSRGAGTSTRSRPAAMGSLATARFEWSHCRGEAGLCLRTRFLAGRFRGSMCLRWRREFMSRQARGYLAGYPVVDFKVTVFDGSYHDVDSSEMSFKLAARIAFRKCMEQAKPALLEPVMRVEIEAPG